MASGPAGTGWTYFADNLNAIFDDDVKRGNLGNDFKQKHGSNGNGNVRGTTPYKFGHFVDRGKLLKGSALGQFMIDSGERHWEETSLALLENSIKHSLTQANPKKIKFHIEQDAPGAKATAVVYNQNYDKNHPDQNTVTTPAQLNAASSFHIVVHCPQPNPRP